MSSHELADRRNREWPSNSNCVDFRNDISLEISEPSDSDNLEQHRDSRFDDPSAQSQLSQSYECCD